MRYLRLWLEFIKMSAMADAEYRLNFLVRIFGEIMWYTAQLSVFEVLYTHTETLNGWDIHAVRVFMGSLFLADVLYMIFFMENMDAISNQVRKGELDLILVKPVNSQFLISCRKVGVAYGLNLLLILGYLGWGMSRLPNEYSAGQLLSYFILIVCGSLIAYCMRFLFAMLVLVLHDAGNIQFVWYQLYRLGTRPDILYPKYLRYFVLTFLPVAFIASVPAKILVEGPSVMWLGAGLTAATALMALTSFLWHRALRRYASASS